MMKKYYRNRHSTFIKALLDQKKEAQQAEEEKKDKIEKKLKKIKDKALANFNVNLNA